MRRRDDIISIQRKGGILLFAGVSKVHPLRHLPNDLSLQVVKARRTGSLVQEFADYTCISEDLNTQQLVLLCKTDFEGRLALELAAEFREPLLGQAVHFIKSKILPRHRGHE